MTTKQIKIGTDCIEMIDFWKCPGDSYSDAIRRMNRRLEDVKHLHEMRKKFNENKEDEGDEIPECK